MAVRGAQIYSEEYQLSKTFSPLPKPTQSYSVILGIFSTIRQTQSSPAADSKTTRERAEERPFYYIQLKPQRK